MIYTAASNTEEYVVSRSITKAISICGKRGRECPSPRMLSSGWVGITIARHVGFEIAKGPLWLEDTEALH